MGRKPKPRKLKTAVEQVSSTDSNLFSLCLGYLSTDSDYESIIDDKQMSKKLHEWEQKSGTMTWSELRASGRKKWGYEIISDSSLRISPPTKLTELDDKVISFHWKGNASIIGIRHGAIFYPYSIERDPCQNKHYNHGGS